MAVVDASIPLQAQMPQFMSPMQAAQGALSLRDLQAQTQLRQMQVMQGQQTLRDQQELSALAASRDNIDPATGGFTAEAIAQINNPMLRQKLNNDRMNTLKLGEEIKYKASQAGQEADKRKTDAIHGVMESAYSAYEDVLKKTGNVQAATDKFNQVQADGYQEIRDTGRGGFSKDQQFRLLTPDDVGAKLITHKERMEEENKARIRDAAEMSPFMKETRYLQQLKGKLADLRPTDPASNQLRQEIAQVQRHIAKLDAPTSTEIKMMMPSGQEAPSKTGNLTGDTLLQALPPSQANVVRAIAEGRMTFSGLGLRGKEREKMVSLVNQYDPTYDEADAKSRYKAMSDFATGKNGNTVRSLNVSIDHLSTLQNAANALKNGNVQMFNQIGNAISAQMGQPAPTDFNATKKIVADEIVKGIVGSGGGVADREEAAKSIAAVNSPAQLAGVVNRYKDLLAGQLGGLKKQYKATTKRDDFEDRFLTPEARQQLSSRNEPKKSTVPNPMLQPKKISSDAEYNALPSGAEFIAPDGSHRRKP